VGATGQGVLGATGITSVFAGSLTATGSSSQSGSLPITAMTNIVTTCSAGNGVRLVPGGSGTVGGLQRVINATSAACLVYPNGTDQINSLGAGVAASVSANASADFWLNAVAQWYAR
jgi:hypothetical protein